MHIPKDWPKRMPSLDLTLVQAFVLVFCIDYFVYFHLFSKLVLSF